MSLERIFKMSVIVNMIDKLSGPAGQADDALGKLNNKFNGLTKSGLTYLGTGAAITSAVLAPVKATYETSRALGELSSLGIKNLNALSEAGKDFSNTWAGTTKADFTSSAYDIKSGIASLTDEGVAGYTEMAGITAKATKASIGQMTDLFATGYGIYKGFYSDLSDIEFAEVFSAGIAKSVQAFKTDGTKMAQAISTLGASATTAQVPLEEQLSILGMLQATMGGSEAGTKYKAFMQSAAKAGDALGLAFVDANGQLKAMPDILRSLQGKFGETMSATEKMELTKAFGTEEAVALVDLLYNKTGELEGNISTMYDTMGQGIGVATEMANAINSTDPDQAQLLSQKVQTLKEDIGTLLLPQVNKLVAAGQSVIIKISEWVANHQRLSGAIMVATLVLGVLLSGIGIGMVIIGGLGVVITSFIKTMSGLIKNLKLASSVMIKLVPIARTVGMALWTMGVRGFTATGSVAKGMLLMGRQAIVAAMTAMPGLIASVWAFTTALLANPITWIIVGIVALIGVIILLYNNWDKVTAFMSSVWQGVCAAVSAGIGTIKGVINDAVVFVSSKIEWFRTAGSKIITTLTAGIKSVAMAPVNAIKGIFNSVRQFLPFSDAKVGPLSDLTLSGQRTITTIVEGMAKVESLPGEQTAKSLAGVNTAGREIKKISFEKTVASREKELGEGKGKTTIIQKLVLNVTMDKIKDLPKLFKLLEDFEDMANSGEDPDLVTT